MSHLNSDLSPAIAENGGRTEAPHASFAGMASALEPSPSAPFGPRAASGVASPRDLAYRGSDHRPSAPPAGKAKAGSSVPNLAHVESEDLLREILRRVGEDPDREGLRQTPDRIVRSWKEIYGGYQQRSEDILSTQFQAERYDEMVLLRDIEFSSTCEHHMLPFHGKAHIAYLPNDRILGLSKLARLLDMYARRLQVQERLTQQVASELHEILRPKGVAVMIKAKHQCMCCRGVHKQEATMVTSCLLGLFKENTATRTEFLALVNSSIV